MATPPFDYKAELSCIPTEIETKLKHQFKDLFTQMEQKLDNFMKQSASSMKNKNILIRMWPSNLDT